MKTILAVFISCDMSLQNGINMFSTMIQTIQKEKINISFL